MRAPIYLLGAQGVGKSTVGRFIARNMGGVHLSAGTLLRHHSRQGGKWASEIDAQLPAGKGVSTKISYGILEEELNKLDDRHAVILDGYPRDASQLDLLRKTVGFDPGRVLLLNAPRPIAVERLVNREICDACGASFGPDAPSQHGDSCDCGGRLDRRPDDHPMAIARRLDGWTNRSGPILAHFERRGVLVEIDASQRLADVLASALQAVEDLR